MLLPLCALGVTMSWDLPGARASRPHQAWHGLGHLPHLDQPAAPWLSFGLAGPPTGWLPAASTEAQRRPKGQDAGGTPALPGDAVPVVRSGVSGGRRKPTCVPLGNSRLPASPAPAPHDGPDHSRVKQVLFQAILGSGRQLERGNAAEVDPGFHRQGAAGNE